MIKLIFKKIPITILLSPMAIILCSLSYVNNYMLKVYMNFCKFKYRLTK
jgi:hypothetical protein